MSTETRTAPLSNNRPIGFVEAPINSNLPYPNLPPGTNLASNNVLYPTNNQTQHNFQYSQHQAPYLQQNVAYAPNPTYPPMGQNVYTTQPGPNTIIIQEQKLTSEPMTTQFPNCKEIVTTKVKYKSGKRTHGAALLLCALDQDCCAILPYCCDQAKDAHHNCPKCGHYFGKKEPSL